MSEIDISAKAQWERCSAQWGFKPEDFGRKFRWRGGQIYKIVGCHPKRPKYPIEGESLLSKRRSVFTVEGVLRGLLPLATPPG